MKVNTVRLVTRVSILSLIAVSIMYGAGIVLLSDNTDTTLETTYSNMSTTQLQSEVERLSKKEELPFTMGLELIKRWAQR